MERTIQPEDLKEQLATRKDLILLDVRRKADYDADQEKLPGAEWRDPDKVDEWSSGTSQGQAGDGLLRSRRLGEQPGG